MRDEDRDQDFWQRKAPQYDRVAKGLFGRPLTRVLELTANGVASGDTVLEVAAGTGLITAVIARGSDGSSPQIMSTACSRFFGNA